MYSIVNRTRGDGVIVLSGEKMILHAGESIPSAIKPTSMTRGVVCVEIPVVKKQDVVKITPTPIVSSAKKTDKVGKTDKGE